MASTPRTFDKPSGQFKDAEPSFWAVSAWRQMAENAAESLQRGSRVIVQGTVRQRSYEDKEGVKRTVYEIQAEDIGCSLKFAACSVKKAERQDNPVPAGATANTDNGGFSDDPPF